LGSKKLKVTERTLLIASARQFERLFCVGQNVAPVLVDLFAGYIVFAIHFRKAVLQL